MTNIGIKGNDRCVASKEAGTVIDLIHPVTGLTFHYGKTLADCQAEYPDAEIMLVSEFCAWKAEKQRTPITWGPVPEAQYIYMLEVLPPAAWVGDAFLVGEPYDHDAGNGQPRYEAYRKRGSEYETASRPMTVAEFTQETKQAVAHG